MTQIKSVELDVFSSSVHSLVTLFTLLTVEVFNA